MITVWSDVWSVSTDVHDRCLLVRKTKRLWVLLYLLTLHTAVMVLFWHHLSTGRITVMQFLKLSGAQCIANDTVCGAFNEFQKVSHENII